MARERNSDVYNSFVARTDEPQLSRLRLPNRELWRVEAMVMMGR